MLLLGELLAGRERRRRGHRRGVEAGGAQGGEAGGDLEEISTADASGAQALGQQIQLCIGDTRDASSVTSLLRNAYFIFGSSASRTPSPKNVNDSIVTAMAIDGNTQRCQ